MKYLKISEKWLLLLIIFATIVYTINVIDISFFASDFTSISTNLQAVARFIPDQTMQHIEVLLELISNATTAFKLVSIGLTIFSACATVIGLLFVRFFVKRVQRNQSIFNYLGLLVTSGYVGYSQVTSLGNLNTLPQILIYLLSIVTAFFCGAVFIVGIKKFYDFLSTNWKTFNYLQISMELIKTFSFVAIFYVTVILVSKGAIYITIAGFINQIDLASLIDIMNYINIDFNELLPQELIESGIISSGQINILINNVFDQYVLNYLSSIIHNIGLRIARNLIFTDMISYILVLAGSIGLIFSSNRADEYSKYVVIALSLFMSLVCFVFLNSIVLTICGVAFAAIVVLMSLELLKEYKQ